MRTNSPIGDESPWEEPAETVLAALPDNDFGKLGKSKGYAEIDLYIQTKIDFYKKYFPDGTSVIELTNEQAGAWWKLAAIIVSEFEALNAKIQGERDASKREKAIKDALKTAGI